VRNQTPSRANVKSWPITRKHNSSARASSSNDFTIQPESARRGEAALQSNSCASKLRVADTPTSTPSGSRCNRSGICTSFTTPPLLAQLRLCCVDGLNPQPGADGRHGTTIRRQPGHLPRKSLRVQKPAKRPRRLRGARRSTVRRAIDDRRCSTG
jgi:hypothetical protein